MENCPSCPSCSSALVKSEKKREREDGAVTLFADKGLHAVHADSEDRSESQYLQLYTEA